MRTIFTGVITTAFVAAASLGAGQALAGSVPSPRPHLVQAAVLQGPGLQTPSVQTPSSLDAPGFESPRFLESGEASWYGPRHEGRRTTSGERFDSHKLTAAHPSLPLGSYVRVTVQDTGRSIIVKVNDREPPHGVRCIDLSRAAAQRLGFAGRGVADVTLEAASRDEAVEVAEAPDDAALASGARHASSRHGRPHKRHAHR